MTRRVGRKKITEMRRNRSRRRSRRNRQNPRRTNHKRNPRSIKRTTNGKRVKKRRKRSRKIEGGGDWSTDSLVRKTQVNEGDILISPKSGVNSETEPSQYVFVRWADAEKIKAYGQQEDNTFLWVRRLIDGKESDNLTMVNYRSLEFP